MWDLNRRERCMRFKGHKQEIHIIKCSFGGVNENLVVSGSEDGCVYIWSKEKGDLLQRLEGHI
jgi:WD40 repeat protein